jgi:hypothetical protein
MTDRGSVKVLLAPVRVVAVIARADALLYEVFEDGFPPAGGRRALAGEPGPSAPGPGGRS